MDLETKLKVLQSLYVGVLADSVHKYTHEGVLANVTEKKRKEQMLQGSQIVKLLKIHTPEEIFTTLSEITNCTKWEIYGESEGFVAEAKGCQLCTLAKRLSTGNPCHIYCLNPMEGMLKGFESSYKFIVKETLWNGDKCRIEVVKLLS